MERWCGKIAVVTGASSGIGSCISRTLIQHGIIVIGLSRKIDRLENVKNDIEKLNLNGRFHYVQCDVTDPESVKMAFEWITNKFQKLHILINNAGIFKYTGILNENNEDDLKAIINTNFMGSVYCTKRAYEIMKRTNEECHIINMNSILGHITPVGKFSGTYNLYPSSKFALRAATEVLRQELLDDKNFRISNISPGLVKTDISHKAGHPDADRIVKMESILLPDDIADAIKFVLSVPKHVQISELVIIPVGQKF